MFDQQTLNRLFRYCYTLTSNSDSAYDLLYSCIEKQLSQNNDKNNSDTSLAYMRTIIRNRFIDQYRKDKLIQYEEIDEQSITDIDCRSLENIIIDNDMVEQMLSSLHSDEREILYLWAVEEMTAKEIADQTDTPRGTILSKIFRLRKKLEQEFGATIYEPEVPEARS